MRTETYNSLKQHCTDRLADLNQSLVLWDSDPVGIGTTFVNEFDNEPFGKNIEFLCDRVDAIDRYTRLSAKLDELHGV
jgi:hypothetical protein